MAAIRYSTGLSGVNSAFSCPQVNLYWNLSSREHIGNDAFQMQHVLCDMSHTCKCFAILISIIQANCHIRFATIDFDKITANLQETGVKKNEHMLDEKPQVKM